MVLHRIRRTETTQSQCGNKRERGEIGKHNGLKIRRLYALRVRVPPLAPFLKKGVSQVLTFNKYQEKALKTAIYPDKYKVMYTTMGLTGEAGEVANKVKKVYRDRGGVVDDKTRTELAAEIGDVLWYCACLCSDLGLSFNSVALNNLHKLEQRDKNDTLAGSGDSR